MTSQEKQLFQPLLLDFKNFPCLIIGAGPIAARKAKALLSVGARLTIVAPECSPAMQMLLKDHEMTVHERCYEVSDLTGQRLVIAATDNESLNTEIAADAKHRSLFVNVVEPGYLSNAFIPATINRYPLQIAIFSGGAAPALVSQLQRQLEAFIPKRFEQLAAFAKSLRMQVKKALPEIQNRRQFWRDLMGGPIAEKLLAGDVAGATSLANLTLTGQVKKIQRVDIIEVGSADPELLTLRAVRLLQQPDFVVYDQTLNGEILELIPLEVERIAVLAPPDRSILNQTTTINLVIKLALQGKHVVCLQSGNHQLAENQLLLVDGLVKAGIDYRIVPSVHSAEKIP